ncbi:MAG: RIP metalloprotease RseP [Planctomycetota bacterium]|nr:RIP metalloprotease RseP [Planctomycetota bacterium]
MSHLILAALDPLGVIMTVIGLGALIFFHELGHFLACRLTGTRVEAFSVGFGPEIFGWTRGHTRYRIAWIPLGGYVKMAAENPGEVNTGAPDEFPNKSFSARLFIMSNGVIFNLILAFVFFVWAFRIGVPFQRAEVGDVVPGGAAWSAGLQAGDLITHVNDKRILGFADLQTEIAFSGEDELLTLRVDRNGESVELVVKPEYSEDQGMPAIQVASSIKPAAAGVIAGSAVAEAGGREGDRVLAVNGRPVHTPMDLAAAITRLAGEAAPGAKTVPVDLLVRRKDGGEETITFPLALGERPQAGIQPFEGRVVKALADRSFAGLILQLGDEVLQVNGAPVVDFGLLREYGPAGDLGSVTVRRAGKVFDLAAKGAVTVRVFARSVAGDQARSTARIAVRPGMGADRSGLKTGDVVTAVSGRTTRTWRDIVTEVTGAKDGAIAFRVQRGETPKEITVTPSRFPAEPASGPLGYQFARQQEFYRESGVGSAMATGWRRTTLFVRSVVLTIRSLVTRRVSAEHIGGPMMLANVTYRVLDLGWGKYFYILAIISVNLAILNMLPIPILDGGQIVLLCAEKIRGKPLPERIVGYYQMVGLALILGLMVLAFRNDIVNLF